MQNLNLLTYSIIPSMNLLTPSYANLFKFTRESSSHSNRGESQDFEIGFVTSVGHVFAHEVTVLLLFCVVHVYELAEFVFQVI